MMDTWVLGRAAWIRATLSREGGAGKVRVMIQQLASERREFHHHLKAQACGSVRHDGDSGLM